MVYPLDFISILPVVVVLGAGFLLELVEVKGIALREQDAAGPLLWTELSLAFQVRRVGNPNVVLQFQRSQLLSNQLNLPVKLIPLLFKEGIGLPPQLILAT